MTQDIGPKLDQRHLDSLRKTLADTNNRETPKLKAQLQDAESSKQKSEAAHMQTMHKLLLSVVILFGIAIFIYIKEQHHSREIDLRDTYIAELENKLSSALHRNDKLVLALRFLKTPKQPAP